LPSAIIEVSVNTTMEDIKKTSDIIHEGEHLFVTESNELYLKEDWEGNPRKLCEISQDELEAKISELKQSFADLESEVEEALAQDIDTDALDAMVEKVKGSMAVGDFGALKAKIADKRASLSSDDESNEESDNVEASDNGSEVNTEGSEEESEEDTTETAEEEPEMSDPSDEDSPDSEKEVEAETAESEEDEADTESDAITYYEDIVEKAQELAKQTDWPYVSMELDNLSHEWSDGPDADSDEVAELYQKFNDTVEEFEQRKQEHYEKLDKQKAENLETKKNLLEEFEGIISNETWTATRRVSQMKGQWNSTGPLPSDKGEGLDERFEELLDIFNDHKVDRLVQQRQKEEDNLMLKLAVLEKMERVVKSIDHETENWEEIEKKFDDLTKQWQKIGRVPKEKSNNVWDRYKSAQDDYYDQKYKHNPEHQSKVDRFMHKKEKICEEAEALLEADDLASAAREINRLHRRWKKVGNLPQRDEDKLWARFKSATDEFNERKSNNQEKIREQEEEHYQQKLELIDKANELKTTDDFDKGHDKMQSFMDRWKAIGPVPRKKSDKIWKQFKGAMDEFYDRRRDHFKEVKEERKENLEKKKEILEKLRELGKHEDPIEAVDIAKDLQEKFKNVGYVPIKQKDKMWKQYREACDVIYDRMRAAKSGDKFDQELAKANLDAEDRSKIQKLRKEYNKVKKEAKKLKDEVLQYKEKKTYFKPSSGSNSLLDEVENKIEEVEQKLEKKHQKMESITDDMEEIREESGG